MDLEPLVALAHQVSREEFVAAHLGKYLVLGEVPDQGGIEFDTIVAPESQPGLLATSIQFEVREISKAPGNPYRDRISLGRARNCDIVIRHPLVSKLHAHFCKGADGALELTDLGSRNGTRVNGRPLIPQVPVKIAPGTKVHFGRVVAVVVDAEELYHRLRAFYERRVSRA